MARIGYARCSTTKQDETRQTQALEAAGCDQIRVEHGTGKTLDREVLQAVLEELKPGDTLVIHELDRLGRSMVQMLQCAEQLLDREVGLVTLDGRINTDTMPRYVVKLLVGVMGYAAEMERKAILKRTAEGRAVALENGVKMGRKRSWDEGLANTVRELREQDYINEYRQSQLPENRRFVSVRVDLFRLSDGKSMCLGEHDVGVKVWWEWPGVDQSEGYGEPMIKETLSFIPLIAKGDYWEDDGILKRPDLFAPQCHAIADYPDATGELHIRGVRLGFCCPAHPDWDDYDGEDSEKMHDYQNNPHLGDRVVRALLTLDAWT